MLVPHSAIVAVADGKKLNLFRNAGDETELSLKPLNAGEIDTDNHSGGARHQSSSANPDANQADEDGFAAGVIELLNAQVLRHKIDKLVIIAAPRSLGEMRKHYHKQLETILLAEIAKDLTGHSVHDIEKTLRAA